MLYLSLFFFNDTATTEIYTLSLHDALPISSAAYAAGPFGCIPTQRNRSETVASRPSGSSQTRTGSIPRSAGARGGSSTRSEEHTSELQSRRDLVCRLLLEKKKKSSRKSLT